jgi:hypothetical protein
MASENIKLNKTNQSNFTVDQGYFYTFDKSQDNLLQKTDDGNTAFSYPFDTSVSESVVSSEFDGVYFWSLENPGLGDITIKRWKIDNYICKLQQTYSFTGDVSHTYDSNAFTVEHYHDQLTTSVSGGSSTIYINTYYDHSTISGARLHLGPNSDGNSEFVEVGVTVSGGGVTLVSGTTYSYDSEDEVNYFNHLWVFNDYNGTVETGALYKFNAWNGNYITKYASAAYKDVRACTFYKIESFTDIGDTDMLCYIRGTNTLFVNISEEVDGGLENYGSMVMENIKSDEATVIPVYDVSIDQGNMYRLQDIADEGSSTWSYYNYLLSPLESFVTSISISASPAIIAANNLSTSTILATVKDQFLQPIIGRNVTFSEDGDGSLTGGTVVPTDSDGQADTVYTAGDVAQEVKVTAVVEQTN